MISTDIRYYINLVEMPVAYHGTPFNIDKFSTSNIGNGEGNQAYGWGLYFASNEDVAAWYRDKLTDYEDETEVRGVEFNGKIIPTNTPSNQLTAMERAALDYFYSNNCIDYAISDLERSLEFMNPNGEAYKMDMETLEALKAGKESGAFYGKVRAARGNFYQVNITPSDDQFLLWDAPLSQQTEYVQDALQRAGIKITNDIAGGASLYHKLVHELGSPRNASLKLLSWGIKGNRYLDGSSRRHGTGHYNYVIFDENDVRIMNGDD